jgi:hypothetical protein
MGNTYYAFDFITRKMLTNPEWTQNWIDLFSITNSTLPVTKRILAIVSGAILPVISLTFLHMLITYISRSKSPSDNDIEYEYITVDENGDEVIEYEMEDRKIPIDDVKNDVKNDVKDDVKNDVKNDLIYDNQDEKIVQQKEQTININQPKDISQVLSLLLKQINLDDSKKDLMELKKQLEILSTPNERGELYIDLNKFINNQIFDSNKFTSIHVPESDKLPEITLNQKNENLPIVQIIGDELTTDTVFKSNNTPNQTNNSKSNIDANVSVTLPLNLEQTNEIPVMSVSKTLNDIPETPIPIMSKDNTFGSIETESQTKDDFILDDLNGISPQKKKILVYKEKKN